MARLARVVVAGIARHVAQRDRKSACEHDDAGNRLAVIDANGTTPYVSNALNQYASANGTYYQYDTSGNMIYDGHYVFDYDPENRLNKVKRFEQGPTAMALACDTTLTFTSGGDAQWFSQTQEHYFEDDAAQSGDIGDSQQSWMQATVSGTGYISFYWKVSTDGGDYLRFYIDDQLKEEHAGSAGWNQSTKYYISTGGSHTLKWVYIKNNNGSDGSDCAWVDRILWEVPTPIGVDKGVDSLLSYTSGGNSTWSYVTSGHYGGDSAKSGQISDSNETWMQTTVTGPGTFKFWWKVSSESSSDYLEFYIDDQLQSGSISGSTNWAEKSYNLTGAGTHTLKWRYVKDSSESSGEDCGWVDHVQWSEPIAEPATDAWSTLTYTYDPSGRRIEKRYDDTLVLKYLYDGDHCIAEYDASNNLRRKYIFGPAVDQPICMIEGATTEYYHFDALGSIIALTDESGDAVQVYEYDVYGRVGASDPDHSNRFMFTGREFDKETGLYYYRARYYNAEIGRFLQTDPVGYGAGMNLYRYCRNSPLSFVDPFGLDTIGPDPNPPKKPEPPKGTGIIDSNEWDLGKLYAILEELGKKLQYYNYEYEATQRRINQIPYEEAAYLTAVGYHWLGFNTYYAFWQGLNGLGQLSMAIPDQAGGVITIGHPRFCPVPITVDLGGFATLGEAIQKSCGGRILRLAEGHLEQMRICWEKLDALKEETTTLYKKLMELNLARIEVGEMMAEVRARIKVVEKVVGPH